MNYVVGTIMNMDNVELSHFANTRFPLELNHICLNQPF